MSQIANSFDRTSLKKIGKGALIALGSALVAYLANNMDGVAAAFKDSPLLASVVTAFAGIAINAAKEYLAGVDRQTLEEQSGAVSAKVEDIVQDIKEQAVEEVKKDSPQIQRINSPVRMTGRFSAKVEDIVQDIKEQATKEVKKDSKRKK